MKTPKLCFVPEKYVCVKDFSLMFFVKRTWELKTVSFTWSCSGFVFWKRLEMDLGTPSWGIYTGHLGCLPWEGDSVVRDTSEGKRTPAWTLLRIPRSSWMLISFSMTEENALSRRRRPYLLWWGMGWDNHICCSCRASDCLTRCNAHGASCRVPLTGSMGLLICILLCVKVF